MTKELQMIKPESFESAAVFLSFELGNSLVISASSLGIPPCHWPVIAENFPISHYAFT
jgi:hypothetical protein